MGHALTVLFQFSQEVFLILYTVFSILIIIFVGFHGTMFKYHLRAEMKRPLLNKDLQSQAEFIVENKVKLYYLLVLLLTLVLFLQLNIVEV